VLDVGDVVFDDYVDLLMTMTLMMTMTLIDSFGVVGDGTLVVTVLLLTVGVPIDALFPGGIWCIGIPRYCCCYGCDGLFGDWWCCVMMTLLTTDDR